MKEIKIDTVLDFIHEGGDLKASLETLKLFSSEKLLKNKFLALLRNRQRQLTPKVIKPYISKKIYKDVVCPTCKKTFNTWRNRIYCKTTHHPSYIERKRLSKRFIEQCKPKWVSWYTIANFYAGCPPGYEVDHIIPINHPDVCGLHVPWNLQYLPKEINNKKSNKWDGTYDNLNWDKT